MKPILCAGLVCLDQVTVVNKFPEEDTDQRSLDQYKVELCGLTVDGVDISEPGRYLGTFALSLETDWLRQGMREDGVEIEGCPEYSGHTCPNSVVISNITTGSRTIIHTNLGLPELQLEHFKNINLSDFSWIHLEGRNKDTLLEVLKYLKEAKQIRFSVEVEKVGRGFEDFIPYADIVFVSKDVALEHGLTSKEEAVAGFKSRLKEGGGLVVAWGELGAACFHPAENNGEIFSCPASPPQGGVLDTLGAGDTFNAAVIGGLAAGLSLSRSVSLGCRLAGLKVGFRGFAGLKGEARSIMKEALCEI